MNERKLFQIIVTLGICFSLGMTLLKAQAPANALLYKIEGKEIKPSYLYGTFHLIPSKDFVLKEKVKTAFDDADLIVLELDMDDPNLQAQMMRNMMLPGDLTLKSLFSEADYIKLDKELQTTAGMGIAAFNKMKPLILMQLLLPKFVGEQPASYEGTFVQMAMDNKKEILGLETVADQMAVFDAISYQSQADDIAEMLKDDGEMKDIFAKMIELYKKEDAEGLYQLFEEFYKDRGEDIDIMLDDRNKKWIPKIGEYAKDKEVFFGVGAGHLGGEDGVVNLLKEAGYTVTAVK